MTRTILFIDADNQPPALAPALTRFLKGIDRHCAQAIVAGNGMGDRVRGWEQALQEAVPSIAIRCHLAPLRKQSADVRLMFELAPFYHGEPDPSMLIVVLSRDDLLLAATECLAAQGHNALIAVGASPNGTPLVTELSIVVLPVPQQAVVTAAPEASSDDSHGAATKIDTKTISTAIVKIRQTLSPNKQGGYSASAVGQLLSQLGHDKAARTQILRTIPNLKEAGVGGDKVLIF